MNLRAYKASDNNMMELYSIVLLGVVPGLVVGRLNTNIQYAAIKGTHNSESSLGRQLKGPKTATTSKSQQ